MGIDIYLRWPGQTKAEEEAQYTAFSVESGHVGYLREAYHGGPYVTKYLVWEAFESETGEALIPAHVLRERLPAAVLMSLYRGHKVYAENDPAIVKLDGGMKVLAERIKQIFEHEISDHSHDEFVSALSHESLETAKHLIDAGVLGGVHKAFVEFVELCERKERETNETCRVSASW